MIYDDDKNILLAKSPKWNAGWLVPGGHLEWGEKLEEAVVREVKEETNLSVTDVEFLYIAENVLSPHSPKPKHFVFIDYCCKCTSKDVKLNEELSEYNWFAPQQALSLPMTDEMRGLIRVFVRRFGL